MAIYRTHAPYHKRYRPVHDMLVVTHPLYQVWGGMKERCNNPDNPAYVNYGGRGITVCDEWNTSFEQFALDMGMKPSLRHSIDRIDNNKGYCKENCRWATKAQQMRNRRKFKTNTSGATGVVISDSGSFIARYDDSGIRYHLGYFQTLEAAIEYREHFIILLSTDRTAALKMTERRARYDSGTQIRGITVHIDGFMVRKTIAGKRIFVGLAGTLDLAIDMLVEFEALAEIDINAAISMVNNRPRGCNKTGIRGISKKGAMYVVKKNICGKRVYLGTCATLAEAEALWNKS